ncbi:MAG: dihydrofolate reductase [Clostridiaceae bacterium]
MISLIVAVSKNNVIGKDKKMLWDIPIDMKRFKEMTTGHIIVMGRKTFESLPYVLPNRKHIVITRNQDYKIDDKRVIVKHSIKETLEEIRDLEEEVFIIGGGEIYKEFIIYADKLYLTRVKECFQGDTYFYFDNKNWEEIYKEEKENICFFEYKKPPRV